jgi:hypothetical protein
MTPPSSPRVTSKVSANRDSYVAARDQYIRIDTLPTNSPAADYNVRDAFDRNRPIFIQYLNPEIRACYGRNYKPRFVDRDLADMLYATRLAILATENVLCFPASYLFEVPILPAFLEAITLLRWQNCIEYCSHVPDLQAYVEHKAAEYRNDAANPYLGNGKKDITNGLAWRPRYASSAAEDIAVDWVTALGEEGLLASPLRSMATRWSRKGDIEQLVRDVPLRLEGQAFISRFVTAVIPLQITSDEATRIGFFLSRAYLQSYLADLDAVILADFTFADLSCGVGKLKGFHDRVLSARRFDSALRYIQIYNFVHQAASWQDLLDLRQDAETGIVLRTVFDASRGELLRTAVTRARKRYRYSEAASLSEAQTRIAILADEIIAGQAFNPSWAAT